MTSFVKGKGKFICSCHCIQQADRSWFQFIKQHFLDYSLWRNTVLHVPWYSDSI